MSEIIRITRQDLYKRVWETPTRTLAKEFGISDSAIVKICRRHNIPKPGAGDWTCMRRGLRVKKAILTNPDSNPEISITPQQPLYLKPDEPFTNIFMRALAYEATAPQIEVTKSQELHPLIERSRQYLNTCAANDNGRVEPKQHGCLNIIVSPESMNRALRIMNALLKAFEQRGMRITFKHDQAEGTFVNICGEFISMRMLEMLLITPNGKEDRKPGYYDFKPCTLSSWQASTKPSGRLALSLGTLHYTGTSILRAL